MIEPKQFTSAAEMTAHYAAVHNRVFPAKITRALRVAIPEKPTRRRRVAKPKPAPMSFADYLRTINMTAQATALFDSSLCTSFKIETRLTGDIPKKTTLCIEAEVLAQHPGITSAMLRGSSQFRQLVFARHEVWHRLQLERFDLSASAIGRIYNRDHSTVLHGISAHKKRAGIS